MSKRIDRIGLLGDNWIVFDWGEESSLVISRLDKFEETLTRYLDDQIIDNFGYLSILKFHLDNPI